MDFEELVRRVIKKKMEEQGYSIGMLADKVEVDRKIITNLVEGKAGVRLSTVDRIFKVLGIKPEDLIEKEEKLPSVKVYASISAGRTALEPVDILDEIVLPFPIKKNNIIAFKVRGNSMYPSIVDGSILLIDLDKKQPEHEKIFVFYIPYKGAVVKRTIFLNQDKILLKSDNEVYGEFVFTRRDFEMKEVMVVGKVIMSIQVY